MIYITRHRENQPLLYLCILVSPMHHECLHKHWKQYKNHFVFVNPFYIFGSCKPIFFYKSESVLDMLTHFYNIFFWFVFVNHFSFFANFIHLPRLFIRLFLFLVGRYDLFLQGMCYLHKSFISSHGNLSSSNCVINNRWLLKITGFGLHALHGEMVDNSDDGKCRDQLWAAPELLRMIDAPVCGSQKGDVYSFAIILHEIIFRTFPYSSTALKYSGK